MLMKLTHKAAGTFAIAPTPFHDDGRIDDKSIDRLTDFYAEVGCDGVTVLGILGEAPKLEGSEAEDVAKRFVKRAKNMQIIVVSRRRGLPRCARWHGHRWAPAPAG